MYRVAGGTTRSNSTEPLELELDPGAAPGAGTWKRNSTEPPLSLLAAESVRVRFGLVAPATKLWSITWKKAEVVDSKHMWGTRDSTGTLLRMHTFKVPSSSTAMATSSRSGMAVNPTMKRFASIVKQRALGIMETRVPAWKNGASKFVGQSSGSGFTMRVKTHVDCPVFLSIHV